MCLRYVRRYSKVVLSHRKPQSARKVPLFKQEEGDTFSDVTLFLIVIVHPETLV